MKPLDEIKARMNAATPGPFSHFGGAVLKEGIKVVAECAGTETLLPEWADNAIFFSHARTDIPRLVKALERAWDILEKMKSASECDFNEMPYWANKAIVESESILNGEGE